MMFDGVVLYADNTCRSISNGSKGKALSLESYKEAIWRKVQRRIFDEPCPVSEQRQASSRTVNWESTPRSGRHAELPEHLNKVSNEACGSSLRGLPAYNSPFSWPSWFPMWWHFLLGREHQNQACSTQGKKSREHR